MDQDPLLDLHQLRAFVAAAETGSISAAAARVGLSQPSLSQQIKKLEHAIGATLFDRLARGVVPTDAGAALLPRAQHILAEVHAAAAAVHTETKQGLGRLRVGAIPTIAPYLIPPVVSTLRDRYPSAELSIKEDFTERLLEQIDAHELDAAILSTPIDHERIDLRIIGEEPLLVVAPAHTHADLNETSNSETSINATGKASHRTTAQPSSETALNAHILASANLDSISIGELRALPRISLHEMHCLGRQIDGFCEQQLAASTVVCKTTQLATVLELVRLGMGVSIVPAMAARADITNTRRYFSIGSSPPLKRNIAIATRKGRTPSTLTLAFIESAIDAVGHMNTRQQTPFTPDQHQSPGKQSTRKQDR